MMKTVIKCEDYDSRVKFYKRVKALTLLFGWRKVIVNITTSKGELVLKDLEMSLPLTSDSFFSLDWALRNFQPDRVIAPSPLKCTVEVKI